MLMILCVVMNAHRFKRYEGAILDYWCISSKMQDNDYKRQPKNDTRRKYFYDYFALVFLALFDARCPTVGIANRGAMLR